MSVVMFCLQLHILLLIVIFSYFCRSADLWTLISSHQVVVISGATGSGKSTQIPQIILDAMIQNGCGGKHFIMRAICGCASYVYICMSGYGSATGSGTSRAPRYRRKTHMHYLVYLCM